VRPAAAADDANTNADANTGDDNGGLPLAALPPPAAPYQLDAAARLAVDRFVRPGAIVGLGRGEMVQRAVAAIGQRIKEGKLGNVSVVASAAPAAAAAAFHGVPVQPTSSSAPVVFFDEADQIDLVANAYLSGSRSGEAAHPDLPAIAVLVEQTLARGGEVVALLPSAAACVPRLNAALPIAIAGASSASSSASGGGGVGGGGSEQPAAAAAAAAGEAIAAWEETAEELDDLFLGDAELWRRPQDPQESANPRGGRSPLIQPDGTTIVDARFYEGLVLFGDASAGYEKILEEVGGVEGVVATGLFVGKATAAVVPGGAGEGEDAPPVPRVLLRKGDALVDDE
jgi:ribose 5-phosphate isomerase A